MMTGFDEGGWISDILDDLYLMFDDVGLIGVSVLTRLV